MLDHAPADFTDTKPARPAAAPLLDQTKIAHTGGGSPRLASVRLPIPEICGIDDRNPFAPRGIDESLGAAECLRELNARERYPVVRFAV